MRTAEPKLRKAFEEGTATELGWLVTGDELLLDMTGFKTGQVGEFVKEFPTANRWVLNGFDSPSKLRLRPALIASEGLSEEHSDDLKKVINLPGWRPSVNVLFSIGRPSIVRRDSLGRPRMHSSANLPTSWSLRGEQ